MSLRFNISLAQQNFHLNAKGSIKTGDITAIYGPSGCGKSSLLRCLAGLEKACQADISFEKILWQDYQPQKKSQQFLLPEKRDVSLVLQQSYLFPHLTAAQNIAYGYQRRRYPGPDIKDVVDALALDELLSKMPHQLSGGQRQRIALARALVNAPKCLLLDEPLAALDWQSRQQIMGYLQHYQNTYQCTLVFVTHQLTEVSYLANQLMLMHQGEITETGPVAELLCQLDSPMQQEPDAGALLSGKIYKHEPEHQLSLIALDGHADKQAQGLWVNTLAQPKGSHVRVHVAARDVSLTLEKPKASSILNVLPAKILSMRASQNAQQLVCLALGQQKLLAKVSRKSADRLQLKQGMAVYAQIKGTTLAAIEHP